jgi:hypothetical protein
MYASIPPINQYGCFTVNRTWKEKHSDKKFQIFFSLPIYKSGEGLQALESLWFLTCIIHVQKDSIVTKETEGM